MEKHTVRENSQIDNQSNTEVQPETSGCNEQNAHLTHKETREIVTPYAFFVADDLLGTSLAGPFRRGFGLLIDLFFVLLLTQINSLVLAAVAAWTFFRAGNRLKTKKRFNTARIFLRLLVALLLFIVAMGIVDEINDANVPGYSSPDVSVNSDSHVDGMEVVAITAKYLLDTKTMKQQVTQGECEPAYDCLKTLGEELVQDIVDVGLDRDAIDGVLEGYLGVVTESLSTEQATELTDYLQHLVESKQSSKNHEEPIFKEPEPDVSENANADARSKGIISWLESLMEELGLGLGWAAFYFSIFTAWWKGQTPGKKLMGIKVIKLDNTALNLWESFGRYGGYAAGLATGLMGFMQVFWDPNRQAIQDKISETLVIDLRKPKVPFIQERSK